MAIKRDMAGGGSIIWAFNETSVGAGGNNNRRSDVQLVQFYLRQFFKIFSFLATQVPNTSTNSPLIAIDGICGKQTIQGITVFQTYVKTQMHLGGHIDGRVDVSHFIGGSKVGSMYTIDHFNMLSPMLVGESNFAAQLEDHPDIVAHAPELRVDLSRTLS